MELESLTVKLTALESTSHQLETFKKSCQELRRDLSNLADLRSHLLQCEKLEVDLETERKGHAEELRQINQALRSERETRKTALRRRIEELESFRNFGNRVLTQLECPDLLEELPVDLVQDILVDDKPSSSSFSPVQPPLDPFRIFQSPSHPPDSSLQSKMKKCDACSALIHRNAPTCPHCKTRSRSKNPKKTRKKE